MEALQTYKNTIGHNHPDTAATLNKIGTVYNSKGASDYALKYYTEALQTYKNTIGHNHPNTAATLSNMGVAY